MRASDRKTCASSAATTPPSLARDRLTEPRAFSLPTQVTDLTQNFKDEVIEKNDAKAKGEPDVDDSGYLL